MGKIGCFIIEDEPSELYIISHFLAQYEDFEIAGTADTANSAVHFLSRNKVDVLFLDINLPDKSGFEILQKIKYQPQIIFTTAYPEYAVKSFEHDVVDFLVKPVTKRTFNHAMKKLMERFSAKPVYETRKTRERHKMIAVNIDCRNTSLHTSEIVYTQSHGNYVKIHTRNRICLADTTTKELLKLLPNSHFIQIHKSFIINTDFVKELKKNSVKIDNSELPVGISFRQYVESYFKNT